MLELHHDPRRKQVELEKLDKWAELGQAERYVSDTELWERFLFTDSQAKERHLVLKWLQGTADHNQSDIQAITEELETKSGRGSGHWVNGWMETREKIKSAKRTRVLPVAHSTPLDLTRSDNKESLVSELDPDAPLRQHRTLEQADAYSERSLWMTCYELLRRGKPWSEICDWCSERNQSWRAVSLGASTDCAQHCPLPGFSAGALWRRVCYQIASRTDISEYEAAAYGLLSGDVASVKAVSKTWDDHVYAVFNALLIGRFDRFQHDNTTMPRHLSPAMVARFRIFEAFSIEKPDAAKNLIERLQENEATADEAKRPFKQVQGSLIANTFELLCQNLAAAVADADWCQYAFATATPARAPASRKTILEGAIAEDYDSLRVVTHMLILFRDLSPESVRESAGDESLDNIIAAYIHFLNAAGKRDLAPLYASKMSPSRAKASLALVLSDVHDIQDKISFIKLMSIYNIDPVAVLVEQSQYLIRNLTPKHERQDHLIQIVEDSKDHVHPGQRIKLDFTSPYGEGGGIADHLVVLYLVEGHWGITFSTLAYACRKLLRTACPDILFISHHS